jgi:hypothetical protein
VVVDPDSNAVVITGFHADPGLLRLGMPGHVDEGLSDDSLEVKEDIIIPVDPHIAVDR